MYITESHNITLQFTWRHVQCSGHDDHDGDEIHFYVSQTKIKLLKNKKQGKKGTAKKLWNKLGRSPVPSDILVGI